MTTFITGPVAIFGGGDDDKLTVTATYDPTNRWNGFVASPLVTRAEVEKIIAFLNGEDVTSSLTFDGDVLVYTTDPGTPDAYTDRVEPNDAGLYDVGLGWVWEPDDEPATVVVGGVTVPQATLLKSEVSPSGAVVETFALDGAIDANDTLGAALAQLDAEEDTRCPDCEDTTGECRRDCPSGGGL